MAVAVALGVPINGTAPRPAPAGVQERRAGGCSTAPASRCRWAARTSTAIDDVAARPSGSGRQRPRVGGGRAQARRQRRRRRQRRPRPAARCTTRTTRTAGCPTVDGAARRGSSTTSLRRRSRRGDGSPATRFAARACRSTSVPDGEVRVLATHDQVLGGDGGQVYLGCRFPADPAYAADLAEHAAKRRPRSSPRRAALGRFSVDFVAAARRARAAGRLRARGQPAQGRHDAPVRGAAQPGPGPLRRRVGQLDRRRDGSDPRLPSTDNLVDPSWLGLDPRRVIDSVRATGSSSTR